MLERLATSPETPGGQISQVSDTLRTHLAELQRITDELLALDTAYQEGLAHFLALRTASDAALDEQLQAHTADDLANAGLLAHRRVEASMQIGLATLGLLMLTTLGATLLVHRRLARPL